MVIYYASAVSAICAVITTVGDVPPFDTGVIATFVEVHARSSKAEEVLYLPYVREQASPVVGQRCAIKYLAWHVNGIVGRETRLIPEAKVIEQIVCK
jgi:hypothetical protein